MLKRCPRRPSDFLFFPPIRVIFVSSYTHNYCGKVVTADRLHPRLIMEDKGKFSAKESAKVKFSSLRNHVKNFLGLDVSDYL